jgi:hypothetical protein
MQDDRFQLAVGGDVFTECRVFLALDQGECVGEGVEWEVMGIGIHVPVASLVLLRVDLRGEVSLCRRDISWATARRSQLVLAMRRCWPVNIEFVQHRGIPEMMSCRNVLDFASVKTVKSAQFLRI